MDASKRRTLQTLAGLGALAALPRAWAQVRAVDLRDTPVSRAYDLTVAETPLNVTGKPAQGITINGTMPGPVLRFREGDEVVIRVTNRLREVTGIHWHGLLVPNDQDGVPGVTYPGIRPGETFTYRFKLRQSGTYWYHSHAALQEAAGYFAPLIIEPAKPDPFQYDRDYVVVISDWIDTPPAQVLANLKKVDGYYNYRRVTAPQFFAQLRSAPDAKAREALWAERMEWAKMRMDPTDYSDGGDEWSFLLQGKRPDENWTGVFKPGERVRLRFINASPMNLYDVRIPGLPMTVVQADGQNVNPVEVDEFRIGNGETYDVIVQPKDPSPCARWPTWAWPAWTWAAAWLTCRAWTWASPQPPHRPPPHMRAWRCRRRPSPPMQWAACPAWRTSRPTRMPAWRAWVGWPTCPVCPAWVPQARSCKPTPMA